jgi:hypothetical protein
MSNLVWSLDDLRRQARSQDAEARYWAVDRLIHHFPGECASSIAELLLDDHDATPVAVAKHLAEHGGPEHHSILVRGFRLLRGTTPGLCLQALVRLRYDGVVELAASALKRGELNEPALGLIVLGLAEHGTPEARALVREYWTRRVELLSDPAAMRGALAVADVEEIPAIVAGFLDALERRGTHHAGEVFRTVMDALQIDDAAWCFRTGPSGHIELRKTIKAVESGYDCDVFSTIGKATIHHIAARLRAGNPGDAVRGIAGWTCEAVDRSGARAGDDLPRRIAAAAGAFAAADSVERIERLGGQVERWLLGFELSAAFAVARGHDFKKLLSDARGDLERLLVLAELETSFLQAELPAAIASVAANQPERARRAQDWCLRMLEAQGPFFPKVVALETLGELRAVHFIPEVMDYLSDENSYVYGAAEKALSRMGEAILAPALARIESGSLDPDAAHSILVLLCDMGTQAAHDAVVSHLDWFMEAVGPGAASEWVTLFGTVDVIDPLRDWLDEDPVIVGQSLLLLGALHDVPIPEEQEILEAIEDARARDGATGEAEDKAGPDPEGGGYVM